MHDGALFKVLIRGRARMEREMPAMISRIARVRCDVGGGGIDVCVQFGRRVYLLITGHAFCSDFQAALTPFPQRMLLKLVTAVQLIAMPFGF